MTDETELTPEEKMAFQRLPREAGPSEVLEERIVHSLREEGLLRRPGVAPAPQRWLRPWIIAGSMAASLALFASGLVLGQWLGTRSTSEVFLAVRAQVAAALSELRGGGLPAPVGEDLVKQASDFRQGQEVALGALYGAVYELARLSPEDVDVLRVLQILEARRDREEGLVEEARNVVWF
jgi:hypothetical protein